jgi:hypothetical protein
MPKKCDDDDHISEDLNSLNGQVKTYATADCTVCEDEERHFPVEFQVDFQMYYQGYEDISSHIEINRKSGGVFKQNLSKIYSL